MDHPLIAAAEVLNALTSYGEILTWSSFPANKEHPIFDIAAKRVAVSAGHEFVKSDLLNSYFGSIDPQTFIETTWSKPRDIIRFFTIAKKMYSGYISLPPTEFKAVLRQYSNESWTEIKTAATAFLPPDGIVCLEQLLRVLGPREFEGARISYDQFCQEIVPVYSTLGKTGNTAYSRDHLAHLLYILGIFYTRYTDASKHSIVYAYHRGNRFPAKEGNVFLHRAIARAFS